MKPVARMRRVLFVCFGFLAAAGVASGMTCTSASGCADCWNDEATGQASCIAVNRDAHCECSISVATPTMCILEDTCDYTGGGGGGTG